MNILITGASGYVGGRLAGFLAASFGANSILLCGRNGMPQQELIGQMAYKAIDWLNDADLEAITKNVDVVIHAAGMNSGDCEARPYEALIFNGVATARLLNFSVQNRVKKFLFLSTAHVYGSPLVGTLTEESCCRNSHPYATSNRVAEDYIKYLNKTRKIEATVLRMSNVIGPPVSINSNCWQLIVNDLCMQVVKSGEILLRTNGKQHRDFVAIYDIERAVQHLLEVKKSRDTVFNLSSGLSVSIYEMAVLIQQRASELLGVMPKITINSEDKTQGELLHINNEKLLMTGFTFCNDFARAIDETLLFCKEHQN